MAIISIDDRTRISSDAKQWILQTRSWSEEKQIWKDWVSKRFYSSISTLIQDCAEMKIRQSDAENIKELIAEVKRIGDQLSEALKPALNVSINQIGK